MRWPTPSPAATSTTSRTSSATCCCRSSSTPAWRRSKAPSISATWSRASPPSWCAAIRTSSPTNRAARRRPSKACGSASRPRKSAERGETAAEGALAGVPVALPALTRALKLQNKAGRVGFDWNDPRAVLAKIREEADEIEAALDAGDSADAAKEVGDLLFAVVNLARHLGGRSGRRVARDQCQIRAAVCLDRARARCAGKKAAGRDARRNGRAVGCGEGGGEIISAFVPARFNFQTAHLSFTLPWRGRVGRRALAKAVEVSGANNSPHPARGACHRAALRADPLARDPPPPGEGKARKRHRPYSLCGPG